MAARQAEHGLQVGVEHRVPVVVLHAHGQGVARDAGVVDQHVQAAVLLDDGVDGGIDRRGRRSRPARRRGSRGCAQRLGDGGGAGSLVAVPMTL
jgi:hypothetical protein